MGNDMKIKHLDAFFENGIDFNIEPAQSSFLFRWAYGDSIDDILSLEKLSIGTLLDISEKTKPSDLVHIISEDLKLHLYFESDKIYLYLKWSERIKEILQLFSQYNNINIPSSFENEWDKACTIVKISPDLCLIDSIAQRFNLTYEQATKIPWTQVLIANNIDLRKSIFESLCSEKLKQK